MRRLVPLSLMVASLALMMVVGGTRSIPGLAAEATRAATRVATKPSTPAATKAAATKAATSAPAAATEAVVGTETPDDASGPFSFTQAPSPEAGSLGITLSDSDPVTIMSTFPNGPAEKSGLQPGDQVVAINGADVSDRKTLIDKIVASKSGDTITLTVTRDGKTEDISVLARTRREVYCPVPESKDLTEGAEIAKDAFSDAKNWTLAGDSTKGVDKVVGAGKLSFKTNAPDKNWVGLVTLRSSPALEYALTLEVTQTGPAVVGILLNFDPQAGNYSLQFTPNGSWSMSAIVDGQNSFGGLSFGETLLKAQPAKDPSATITNTIKIITDGNDMFFYFNGTFACGVPLYIFADPPLDAGNFGLYAVVAGDKSGKAGVSFSNFKLTEVTKK